MVAFHTSQTLSASFQVVLDLGRRPEARFLGDGGGDYLREEEVRRDVSQGRCIWCAGVCETVISRWYGAGPDV